MQERISVKIGDKFNRLTAVHDAPNAFIGKSSCRRHWYECSCGKVAKILFDRYVRTGQTSSCGFCRKAYTKHILYRRAVKILDRCNNPMSTAYKYYGGRGIKCLLGTTPVEVLLNILKIPGFKEGLTLDRIDNNGHYKLSNLRWATRKDQMLNTRYSVTMESLAKKSRAMSGFRKICAKHNWNVKEFIKIRDLDCTGPARHFFIHKSLNNFNDYAITSSKTSSEEEKPLP